MSATPPLPFVKMNGLGNEIVVVDLRGSSKVVHAAGGRGGRRRPHRRASIR